MILKASLYLNFVELNFITLFYDRFCDSERRARARAEEGWMEIDAAERRATTGGRVGGARRGGIVTFGEICILDFSASDGIHEINLKNHIKNNV